MSPVKITQDHEDECEPPVHHQGERQQYEERDEGREMLAEERQPQSPQRVDAGEHHLHQASRMGAAMKRYRKLQHVLEIVGQHRLLAAVREPVGMKRDQHAAGDGEQAERDPCGQQGRQRFHVGRRACGLSLHQRIDDAAEQDRLGELRYGQQNVRNREDPGEPGLGLEEADHAA